ncbi:MAG: hypothetical protein ACM3O8_06515 [Methylococcaceae bacterium]|nr:hypothetical protein [Prolixibacteraceae bacterium]
MKNLKTIKVFWILVANLLMISFAGSSKNISRDKKSHNEKHEYSIYSSFDELIAAKDAKYRAPIRITEGGTKENPTYHGFFFYNCAPKDLLQFDPTGRYMLGMSISIEGREVLPSDTGKIGIIDLQNKNKWLQVGKTTAWNWQQGCRLEWIPGSSEEFIWDDRSADGKSFVSHIYNMRTKQTRTLPRPIYTVSPNGLTALTHDFERMEHGGTNFVGIPDRYKSQWAPEGTGIWRMDLKSGQSEKIVSVRQMAHLLFPDGLPKDTIGGRLYIFREGFNVSGNRFIAFVKDVRQTSSGEFTAKTTGFSMTPEGKDIRYLFDEPSHHFWMDDETIMDNVKVVPPRGGNRVRCYVVFKDDGTGVPKEILWEAPNGHDIYHPSGDWILTDTYSTDDDGYALNGYEYIYMYHIPTKKFVAVGKYEFRMNGKFFQNDPLIFRVDLHPRFSPDGRSVSFDSTHEGLGRQIYLLDIGYILDNPPSAN